jgi:hypothetical protein
MSFTGERGYRGTQDVVGVQFCYVFMALVGESFRRQSWCSSSSAIP